MTALLQPAFPDAGFVATEQKGMCLVNAGRPEDPAGPGRERGGRAPIEDEETEGQTPEVDAGLFREPCPVAIDEYPRWRTGEMMAPMSFVAGSEQAAGAPMGARCNDVEPIAKPLPASPSTAPQPSTFAHLSPCRATTIVPVPAATTQPDRSPSAPSSDVTPSDAIATRTYGGRRSTTASTSAFAASEPATVS